jgi:hypothetical protein
VLHRTTTVACPVRISFHSWRSRPLELRAGWRTEHCPVHTRQSGAPADRWSGPRVARGFGGRLLRLQPLAHRRTVRCTTGQSGEPPDSPVNYSCTPPKTPDSSQFAGSQPGAPNTVWCTTGHCPVCQTEQSLGCFKPSSSLLFFSLILALRQIY